MQLHHTPNAPMAQQPEEIWREIPGSNGRYEVSNYGRVRSWYWRKGGGRQAEPLYNKGFESRIGYTYYRLQTDSGSKNFAAHRLVMYAFVGISELEVNHIDGNKGNNYVGNLEYVSHRENIRHAIDVLGVRCGNVAGVRPPTARDMEMRRMAAEGISQRQIAAHFGVSQPYVHYIVVGKVRP